jgi:hypothetical protein
MPRVGFELTIPVFERAKTVHALDIAATVIGPLFYDLLKYPYSILISNIYFCIFSGFFRKIFGSEKEE